MINLVEDIRSISYVKSHTAEVMKQVGEKNNPMVITQNGEARAVLMDVKQYHKFNKFNENFVYWGKWPKKRQNLFPWGFTEKNKVNIGLRMKHEIIWSKDAGDELAEIISYIKYNPWT